jgi:hypothetical protein
MGHYSAFQLGGSGDNRKNCDKCSKNQVRQDGDYCAFRLAAHLCFSGLELWLLR